MASLLISLWLFVIYETSAQPQTITYQDISCDNTYTATVPANATQYFRFLVPTNETNAVQIDLCQSSYDTVVEVYKYVNDTANNYDGNNYIDHNDDWNEYSRPTCPQEASFVASYLQLSPFNYPEITNYTGYYILKLYDAFNQDGSTSNNYTLKFNCNAVTTTLPVEDTVNCNDRIQGHIKEYEFKLYRINPPPSFTNANNSFNPGFTLDSCNTNFYASYKLLSWDTSEACCMNSIGDSICYSNEGSNGEYLTYRKSDTDLVKWYYLNISSDWEAGTYDIQYTCDIIPTTSPTPAPTLMAGSINCGETVFGTINNGETYSYSFDIPLYANNSKSVTFIDCNSQLYQDYQEEISFSVFRPDGGVDSSSWYQDYSNYCHGNDRSAAVQLYPNIQFNNRTNWNLRVSTADDYNGSVVYNITYVCQDIQTATPSPTPVNFTYAPTVSMYDSANSTFPFNISMNITMCGQELTGVLDSYYNDSQPAVFGFNLYNLQYYYYYEQFTINPCQTQYPLDIKVLAMNNYGKSDNFLPPITKMGKCANGYNDILSWSPDSYEYGAQYVIAWIGTNRSSDKAIYDNTNGSYNVIFDCPPPNITIPIKFTANITQCGQQLSGKLDTYWNESDSMNVAKWYRLDWDYLVRKNILDEDQSYEFELDPCNTQYSLDIKVASLTNLIYPKDNSSALIQTKMMSKCSNGYNYKLSWIPNVTVYGTEYLVAWTGLNTSAAQAIFDKTDGSYEVDFICEMMTTTNSPTTKPTRGPTPQGTDQSANGDTGSKESGLEAVPAYVWLILVIVFAVLAVLFLLLWFRKKKQYNDATGYDNQYVQMTDENNNRKL